MNLKDSSLLKSQCFINGQWCNSESLKVIEVFNPATGELITTVPESGENEAEIAVQSAKKALAAWQAKSAKERGYILRAWYGLVVENLDDLATIMTHEQGKPFEESKSEILYGASYIEWYAEEGKRIYGDIIPSPSNDKRILVTKVPIGVCAAITPWNFPSAMITRKAAPALAAGCSFVVKPASQTPLSALALAELSQRAGIPDGVFNVITGIDYEIGDVFTSNDIVKKFSFTGSTNVGKKLMAQCASTVKKVSLELGGNAPFIVFDDADLNEAVQHAMSSKFRNAGQTCICANRIYVQSGIYEEFISRLTQEIDSLVLGNGMQKDVTCGPLIEQRSVLKVKEHIDDAIAKGGVLITGGSLKDPNSLFFKPTLIKDANSTMKVSKEETFGPLAPVFKFEEEEEVVRLANDTEYGLAAYLFSKDLGRVTRVSNKLEYGMVAVNTSALSNEAAPFGGIKQSGLGREGSKYGIEDYLEIKYILLSGI